MLDNEIFSMAFDGMRLNRYNWKSITGRINTIDSNCRSMEVENQTSYRIELAWGPEEKAIKHYKIKDIVQPTCTNETSFELFQGGVWGRSNLMFIRGVASQGNVYFRFYY